MRRRAGDNLASSGISSAAIGMRVPHFQLHGLVTFNASALKVKASDPVSTSCEKWPKKEPNSGAEVAEESDADAANEDCWGEEK
jgi:hypothetical protein